MTSEAVAEATLEQELECGDEQEIPTLSSVVQSGDIEAIKFAREQVVPEDKRPTQVANDTANPPSHLPEMVFESDLERTIDAIINQHVTSMRAEIKAVLELHKEEIEQQ